MGSFISKEDIILSTHDVLELVYGDSQGHISINSLSETGSLDVERWLSWSVERNFTEKYIGLRSDEDVYYSVAKFSDEARSKDDPFSVARVVWADADTCAPEKFRVKPSIISVTSPGRYHCLWVLDKEYSAAKAEEVAHRISVAHAADGCDKGFTRTKLLRVPNTTNTKGEPFTVTAEDTGARYTLAELEAVYGDVSLDFKIENLGSVPEPVSANDLLDLEAMLESNQLADLYLRKPEAGQSWSDRAYRLQLDCFRLGMNPTQVFSVARNAACNKFDPSAAGEETQTGVVIPARRNPDAAVWTQVQQAYTEFLQEEDVPVEDTPKMAAQSFLTMDERRFVEDNPTWVDRYTDWAMTRSPDGVPDYQRSLGYLILSMMFADRVFMPLQYGPMYPNLWTMIAGLSTLDKKTTAMDYAVDILRKVEALSGETVVIGSDATTEALITTLGKRDGEASLLYTDEIYDFFAEIYTKNYRVGTIGKFTELYGGKVPVVLRATKDAGNKTLARTAFGFLGVGVKNRIAQVLHRDSFESGFLLRMTWTVADERRYKKGDADVAQQQVAADGTYDADMNQIALDLYEQRERYTREFPTALPLTDEALARLNQFIHDLHVASAQSQDNVLEGGVDRLGYSVLKSAAVLSAYEHLSEIPLDHVLAAIRQGEIWFKGLVEMLNAVSTSAFGHTQDTVLAFITAAKDHEVPESAIHRKFKFKPSEFNEIITALVKSGLIKRVDGNRWKAMV